MPQSLLTVRYHTDADPETFLAQMRQAASSIAATPGLAWKIWSFDRDAGDGLSAYLFASPSAAAAFAHGPIIGALRQRPDVSGVEVAHATIDAELSQATGAAPALAAQPAWSTHGAARYHLGAS